MALIWLARQNSETSPRKPEGKKALNAEVWSQFLWNVHLIIAHHVQCIVFADSAGWPGSWIVWACIIVSFEEYRLGVRLIWRSILEYKIQILIIRHAKNHLCSLETIVTQPLRPDCPACPKVCVYMHALHTVSFTRKCTSRFLVRYMCIGKWNSYYYN